MTGWRVKQNAPTRCHPARFPSYAVLPQYPFCSSRQPAFSGHSRVSHLNQLSGHYYYGQNQKKHSDSQQKVLLLDFFSEIFVKIKYNDHYEPVRVCSFYRPPWQVLECRYSECRHSSPSGAQINLSIYCKHQRTFFQTTEFSSTLKTRSWEKQPTLCWNHTDIWLEKPFPIPVGGSLLLAQTF